MAANFTGHQKLDTATNCHSVTKGTTIAVAAVAKGYGGGNDVQHCVIPPGTVVFSLPRDDQDLCVTRVTTEPGRNHRLVGVAVAGIPKPQDALDFPDSSGRFAVTCAGQARLTAKAWNANNNVFENFKPNDDIWVRTDAYGDGLPNRCGMKYYNGADYSLPEMRVTANNADEWSKLGTVVSIVPGTSTMIVELKLQ
mgnify:CR=1 FL=1